jgi:hypothetical protein
VKRQKNIARPAQNFRLFLEHSVKEIEELLQRFDGITEALKVSRDEQSGVEYAFRHIGVEFYLVEWVATGASDSGDRFTDGLKRTGEDLETALRFVKAKDIDMPFVTKLIGYAVGYAEAAKQRLAAPEVLEVVRTLDEADRSGGMYTAFTDEFGDDFPMPVMSGAIELVKACNDARLLVDKVIEHCMALLYQLRGEMPAHEPVEVLFHASVAARQLYGEGFSKTGAKRVSGIGQFGGVLKTTSFTSAEWLAQEIARALLEATHIAQGRISVDEVLGHAAADGVLDDVIQLAKRVDGLAPEDASAPHQIMKFYTYYLGMAERAGKRYNPLFVGDMEDLMVVLAGVDPANIGYVATNVDMADQGIKYLSSMYEYQVPPRAILDNLYWVPAETDWV